MGEAGGRRLVLRDYLAGEENHPGAGVPGHGGARPAILGGAVELEEVGAEEGAEAEEPLFAKELPADQELEAEVGEVGEGEAGESEAPVEDGLNLHELPVESVAEEADQDHHVVAEDPASAGEAEAQGRGPAGGGVFVRAPPSRKGQPEPPAEGEDVRPGAPVEDLERRLAGGAESGEGEGGERQRRNSNEGVFSPRARRMPRAWRVPGGTASPIPSTRSRATSAVRVRFITWVARRPNWTRVPR